MSLINPVSAISSAKQVTATEPTVADNQKAFEKALGALSKNLEAGNLTEAKKAYVKLDQAAKDLAAQKSQPKAGVQQLKKSVDAVGTAFRTNDSKAVEKAVSNAKKAFETDQASRKAVDAAILTAKQSKAAIQTTGVASANSDAYRSLFNAIA